MIRSTPQSKRPITHRAATLMALAAVFIPLTARPDDESISPQTQSAVDRGLEILARMQKQDGSWSENGDPIAITGLATMAFMARGHVPGQGPYGEQLNRAIDFILANQKENGLLSEQNLSQPMYDHGICTITLCEAYGMLDERRQEKARTAISRAVRLILDAQNVAKDTDAKGGWRYTPAATDSDTSVTGWQLMALRGAKNIGAYLPAGAIEAGIAYITRQADAGAFGYQSAGNRPTPALTGTGVLSLILLGQADAKPVKAGGDYLLKTQFNGRGDHYYYSIYYISQAAWQLGGQYWTTLHREISGDLLRRQHADGSWGNDGGGGVEASAPYATSMAVLALTVPYRYLPIYQR